MVEDTCEISKDETESIASLRKMVECARTLSKVFPFVRVDFYQCGNKAVFGEMTFTPAAGIFMYQIDVDGLSMGEMLHIETI